MGQFIKTCDEKIELFKKILFFISKSIKENSSLEHYISIKSEGKIEIVFPDFTVKNIRTDSVSSLKKLFEWRAAHLMAKTRVISIRITHRRRRKNRVV